MREPAATRTAARCAGRVLVTGSAGFLGRHVVAALLAKGWAVLALVHRRSLRLQDRHASLEVIEGDVNDTAKIGEVMGRIDAVCHLAAYVPPSQVDPAHAEMCLRTNALATLRLAEMALAQPVRSFIYLSAGNCYAAGDAMPTEESSLYPVDRATYYLASKLMGELYVEHLRRARGLRAVSLRVSTPYGDGMARGSVVSRFMDCASQGLPLEVRDGGIPSYDFVYAADVVNVILAALEDTKPGVYNVGSGTAHSVLQLAEAVVETYAGKGISLDVRPAHGPVPASFRPLCVEKAATTWGYRPLMLREGLADYRRKMEGRPSDCCCSE